MKKRKTIFPKRVRQAAFSVALTAIVLLTMWLVHAVTHVPLPSSDQPILFYANQDRDDLHLAYEKAFKNAKRSILVVVYSLNDPHMIKLLKDSAERGLDVQVICDAKASKGVHKKLGNKVKTLRRSGPGLMHQKITVIDDSDCWIGSANMTADSLRMHGNLVTAMKCEAMAQTIFEKIQGMGKTGKSDPFPTTEYLFGNQKVELWFLPQNPEALPRLKRVIREAAKTLRVAMFTWTHPELTEEIVEAHAKGVDVQVAIDYYAGKGSSAETVKMLQEAGVNVRLSPGGALLHYKMLIQDGKVLVNGSANWTRAAFKQNDDCFLVINDLSQEQQKKLDRVWRTIWNEAKTVSVSK